jgi:CheY-like chemotaxis protein
LESPFKHLFKSVTVLFTDDDPHQLQFYQDIIGDHPLYNVLTASNAQQAKNIILSNVRIHLCVLDMGIDDIEKDEFYLLKRFGLKLPYIVISGSMDMERAFTASQFGAVGMISKPTDVQSLKFWDTLSTAFCNSAILPILHSNSNPMLKECCDVVKRTLPESVTEWAAKVNITDTYLRKLWSDCFMFSPKYMLVLYRMYYHAFHYHNELYLSELRNEPAPQLSATEFTLYRHLGVYYQKNRNECDAVLVNRI